jgi:hypothetical protein
MEGKKHTGDASSVTPYVLGIGAVTGIFTFLLHRSLNPQGRNLMLYISRRQNAIRTVSVSD